MLSAHARSVGAATAALLFLPLAPSVLGGHAARGRLIASKEPGWPQWRGPRRDGISDETGLLQSWPEGGPKLLWTAEGLGRGYSSSVISKGAICLTGDVGKELHVFALGLGGKPKWTAKNGRAWTRSTPGSRSSCALDGGRLFHMNAHGRVVCLDATTGKQLWAVDVRERFEARYNSWGLCESLLVDGPRVIVTPGGKKGLMAALDRDTGKTVWASEAIEGERAAYCSPLLFEFAGRRHIVNLSSRHAFGVDADTGKLLWAERRETLREVNCNTPCFYDGAVFVTCPNGLGSALYRLHAEGEGVRAERAWTGDFENGFGGVVLVGGLVYGSGANRGREWGCVDVRTGKTLYTTRRFWPGAIAYADQRLYCLSPRGVVVLLKPTPKGFETAGAFRMPGRARDFWAHPVICDGRLFLRYHDKLFCFDIKRKT